MSRLEEKDKQNTFERSKKREKRSDSESSSSRDSFRRSSSRTDDDEGRSTPEERNNWHKKNNHAKSRNRSRKRERNERHEKSRYVRSPSNERNKHKSRVYRKDREKDRGQDRRRSYSSDESDSYYRRHKRRTHSRSRSRERKPNEREPRRNIDTSCAQKSGDRRLFPLASDDRNSSSAMPTDFPDNRTSSWRDGGPLPPPVFIGHQSIVPPAPNISGNVPPLHMSHERQKNSINNAQTSDVRSEECSRSSFVPPSYLTMPPNPNTISSNQNSIPPPLALGSRPSVPPPLRPPPGAPPAIGQRPPPPPVRLKMPIVSNDMTGTKPSQEVSQEKIINYHDAPKAPKRLPEIKPEIKRSPPKLQTGQTKNIAIKLGPAPKAKPNVLNPRLPAKVASVFGADDSDSEEEMPMEAKMRMRNVGRETITSSGPNSFGKTRQGFTDTKKLYEKNMHKPLFDDK